MEADVRVRLPRRQQRERLRQIHDRRVAEEETRAQIERAEAIQVRLRRRRRRAEQRGAEKRYRGIAESVGVHPRQRHSEDRRRVSISLISKDAERRRTKIYIVHKHRWI